MLLDPIHPAQGNHGLRFSLIQIARNPLGLDTAPTVVIQQVCRFVERVQVLTHFFQVTQHRLGKPPGIGSYLPAAVRIGVNRSLRIRIETAFRGLTIYEKTAFLRGHLFG